MTVQLNRTRKASAGQESSHDLQADTTAELFAMTGDQLRNLGVEAGALAFVTETKTMYTLADVPAGAAAAEWSASSSSEPFSPFLSADSQLTSAQKFVGVDTVTAAGLVTLTLPASPVDGQTLTVKDAAHNASTNNIRLVPSDAATGVDGGADLTLSADSDKVTLKFDSQLGVAGHWLSI